MPSYSITGSVEATGMILGVMAFLFIYGLVIIALGLRDREQRQRMTDEADPPR
jgi:hypothetical protein